jgi:PEP-CTERM motif
MLGTDMNTKLLAAAAFAALGLSATPSLASICVNTGTTTVSGIVTKVTAACSAGGETVTVTTTLEASSAAADAHLSLPGFSANLATPGYTMIDNFDSVNPAKGFLAQNGNTFTGNGFSGSTMISAAPPGDTTAYEGVQPGNPFTLIDTSGSLSAFSFYMGSPDEYNGLNLTVNGPTGSLTLSGDDIWGGGTVVGTGDQSEGFLVSYQFTPSTVKSLTFSSTSPAFEFDNLAGINVVPEPASWALMIMGFGAAGGMIRSQRRKAALA